jgi:hypothetical protein
MTVRNLVGSEGVFFYVSYQVDDFWVDPRMRA